MIKNLKKSSIILIITIIILALGLPISAVLAVSTADSGSLTIVKSGDPESDMEYTFLLDSASKPNFLFNWGSQGTTENQFEMSSGIAVDDSGNTYVADTANHRVQRYNQDGEFSRMWGKGVAGGTGFETCTSGCQAGTVGTELGEFNSPTDIAVDTISGDVYVVDSNNNRIQKFEDNGTYVTMWGWGVDDGTDELQTCTSDCQAGTTGTGDGQFSAPKAIGTGTTGFFPTTVVYVVDSGNNQVQTFDDAGAFQSKFGSLGSSEAQFNDPVGLGVGPTGNLLIADRLNYRIQELASSGDFVRMMGWGVATGRSQFEVCSFGCQIGISGSGDGQFSEPMDVATDMAGYVHAVDGQDRVQVFEPSGNLYNSWGTSGTADGNLDGPTAIAFDEDSQPLILDALNYRIQKYAPSAFFLVDDTAGGNEQVTYDLPPDTYTLHEILPNLWKDPTITCETSDTGDNPVIDTLSATINLDANEEVTCTFYNLYEEGTIVMQKEADPADGTDFRFYFGDQENPTSLNDIGERGTRESQFSAPAGVALDSSENFYVVDMENNRVQVFDPDMAFLSTWGWGVANGAASLQTCTSGCRAGSFGAGNGQLDLPIGIAIDGSDNIYVADTNNHRIQKFDTSGNFLLTWGSQGASENQFNYPNWVAVDSTDNVYVVDQGNNRVQKFNSSGTFISTWGWGVQDGGAALQSCSSGCQAGSTGSGDGQFGAQAEGIATDTAGNVFVVDASNSRVQKFDLNGGFLGKWGSSGSGDGQFDNPKGIGTDGDGDVYVADQDNYRFQKFDGDGSFINAFGYPPGSGDDVLNLPNGIGVDSDKGIYISETGNHRVNLFKPYIFYLDDGSDSDDYGQELRYTGPTGGFTITEEIVVEGWVLTSIECETDNPSYPPVVSGQSVFVDLQRDNNVTCIFNNLLPVPVDADYEGIPTSGPHPLAVDFTNLSTGDFDTCTWDFNDGETNNSCDNLTHTFNNPGIYSPTLTVSGWGGEETEEKTEYITVYEASNADFEGTPTSAIGSLTVDFTNLSTGDYTTCSWDFGDGGTSSDCADQSHEYTTPGLYTVALTVNGNGGPNTETKTDYIAVYAPVSADFTGTPTTGGAPLTVEFTNTSTGDYDTCAWAFGDGSTSDTCDTQSHSYADVGFYTVTLTLSGPGGDDEETKTDYIGVYNPVSADFSASPLTGIGSQAVAFTNLSTGEYDTCSWDFGDGGSSSDCNDPSHTYSAPGTYSVSLISSGLGGEDTETKTDYITIYVPANAQFSGAPTSGIAALTVDFTNSSTGDYDTCSWTFGDGGTSTACSNPSYSYLAAGVYTVWLTVSGDGGSDTETKTQYVTVYDPANADFSGTPTSGIDTLSVNFSNLSSGDYDTCQWTFGDGDGSNSCSNPNHTYDSPGMYTVSLEISGLGGTDTETKTEYIKVYQTVSADFSGTPTYGGAPHTVDFSNLSTGTYDTCEWTFGDGGTSSDCNDPSHTYDVIGVYTVKLTASGPGGSDVETKTDYIQVYTAVNADFTASPTSGIATATVNFTNLSLGEYDTCNWTFGDGESAPSCDNQTHIYDTPGTYTVTLTASGLGGEDTETKTNYITVYGTVGADFSAVPTTGSAPMKVNFTNLGTGSYDTCTWTFGDGDTSNECDDPSHTYTNPGFYTVMLELSGPGGDDDITKTDYISVYTGVTANFMGSPSAGYEPLLVSFTNYSSGDFDTCSWTFGDGETSSNCDDPKHIYYTPGTYTVSLMVSGLGGDNTMSKTDYIIVETGYTLYLPVISK